MRRYAIFSICPAFDADKADQEWDLEFCEQQQLSYTCRVKQLIIAAAFNVY